MFDQGYSHRGWGESWGHVVGPFPAVLFVLRFVEWVTLKAYKLVYPFALLVWLLCVMAQVESWAWLQFIWTQAQFTAPKPSS